ncbi:hypothetical protein XENTR_v10023852 [Xenopus tropicalis]|nr:hypothetical protein XENTR_v10023852 [Xenopus tropicalis]
MHGNIKFSEGDPICLMETRQREESGHRVSLATACKTSVYPVKIQLPFREQMRHRAEPPGAIESHHLSVNISAAHQ